MKKFFLYAMSVAMIISFSQCSKDGSQGPAGPQGEQGPQGQQGPQGEKGTANVIYSDWITIPSAEWETTALLVGGGAIIRYHDIMAPKLTNDVVDHGIVRAFVDMREATNGKVVKVWSLPKIIGEIKFDYLFSPDTVTFTYSYIADQANTDPGEPGMDFKARYVIIPGGVAAVSRLTKDKIRDMSYIQLKQHFVINEQGTAISTK